MLNAFTADVSHQEIARVIGELQEMFFGAANNNPDFWMNLEAIEMYLTQDLGYEDLDEFEDALNGRFIDFLREYPNCEVRVKSGTDGGKPEDVEHQFKFTKVEGKGAQKLELKIKSRDDLWRVFLFAKAPARIEIPEVEFEIQGDWKQNIDSIYNHLGNAIKNLEQHLDCNPSMENKQAYAFTVEELR